MSTFTFGQKRFLPAPPEKGSFPLDHEGQCKRVMMSYMHCLRENRGNNTMCRDVAKEYLGCRMDNDLMAKEEWSKLGFGSVATIKLPTLAEKFWEQNFEVRVVVTERAKHFFKECDLPPGTQILSDTVEWAAWQDRGDPILHIDLVKWADLYLIAPLDANTLGKMASGMCDNILTCVARAWDPTKPLLFCPAMNTRMWEHPVTAPQISMLKSWGYKEIPCVSKTLMCGDTGLGAMAEVDTIVQATLRALNPWHPYPPSDHLYP